MSSSARTSNCFRLLLASCVAALLLPGIASAQIAPGATLAATKQTITFAAIASQAFGATPMALAASASSSLPVGFTSLNNAVCTVSGVTLTLVAAGICRVRATQAGGSAGSGAEAKNYAAADPVEQSFKVNPAIRIVSASFGDRSYQETCDATWLLVKACHADAVVAAADVKTATVIKDHETRPSYCYAKRTAADAKARYDGEDLCGFKPSPLGKNELTVNYRCEGSVPASPGPTGAAAAGSRASFAANAPFSAPVLTVHFPGYVDWARISCVD